MTNSLPPNSSGRYLIFVYGTLKKGFCRNHYLQGYEMVRVSKTKPVYQMYDCGEYPGLVPDAENGRSIWGEVWSVDADGLQVLDGVEAVGEGLYRREECQLADLFAQPVLVYIYNRSVESFENCGENWTSGQQSD